MATSTITKDNYLYCSPNAVSVTISANTSTSKSIGDMGISYNSELYEPVMGSVWVNGEGSAYIMASFTGANFAEITFVNRHVSVARTVQAKAYLLLRKK